MFELISLWPPLREFGYPGVTRGVDDYEEQRQEFYCSLFCNLSHLREFRWTCSNVWQAPSELHLPLFVCVVLLGLGLRALMPDTYSTFAAKQLRNYESNIKTFGYTFGTQNRNMWVFIGAMAFHF